VDPLADVGRLAREAAREELPALLGRLTEAEAVIRLRLAEAVVPTTTTSRTIDADEAAKIAGQSKRWLLGHTRDKKFRTDHSRKVVKFDEAGLRGWLAGRGK
jgi:hypothetical protein